MCDLRGIAPQRNILFDVFLGRQRGDILGYVDGSRGTNRLVSISVILLRSGRHLGEDKLIASRQRAGTFGRIVPERRALFLVGFESSESRSETVRLPSELSLGSIVVTGRPDGPLSERIGRNDAVIGLRIVDLADR